MRILGTKQKSSSLKRELARKDKREIREYAGENSVSRHRELIEQLSKVEVDEYEQWLHKWGTPGRKRTVMLDQMKSRNVKGPLLALATLRNDDLKEHQRVVQAIRSRWYNFHEHIQKKINSDSDLFWNKMARGMIHRGTVDGYGIDPAWTGSNGRLLLVEYLRTLYEKQAGLCVLSNEQMVLEIGADKKNSQKCSPDRINSDKGYEIGNIQLTVWWVNSMKSNYTTRQFFKKIRTIAKNIGFTDK